jgi:hypothetical protein
LLIGSLMLPAVSYPLSAAQTVAAGGPAVSDTQTQADLRKAFAGEWTGVLEYRDYSEPATSTKRVQLPTWLSIRPDGDGLALHFVYDDGPTKTVESDETWVFDVAGATCTQTDKGKPGQVYRVAGFEKLKSGRGDLVFLGKAIDNDKPAESRTTVTVRRNLIAWTEEVRPEGSGAEFAFRHRYTFTRAERPTAGR